MDNPKSYARCVRMQTLFIEPSCQKWFTVVPARKLSVLNKFLLTLNSHQSAQKRKTQCIVAGQHQKHNQNNSFLHGLPPEVRIQIYEHVLADDVIYSIEDMLGPGTPICRRHDDCHDNDYFDFLRCRCSIETDVKKFYQHNEAFKLRAISISCCSGNPVALLQTCAKINREASPIFYSRNRFFVHSRWGNWTSVNQFLSLLRPQIRRCIQNLGVVQLKPILESDAEPQDRHDKHAALYYSSMKIFVVDYVPQLSLKTLVLCVDLRDDIELRDDHPASDHAIDFSPQAPWLNSILRLSQSEVEVRLRSDFRDDNAYGSGHLHFDSPGSKFIDRLNAIDFRTRIRAKWGYFQSQRYTGLLPHYERPKWRSVRRRKNEEDGFSDLDVWEYIGIPLLWNDMRDEERVKWRNTMERYRNVKDGCSYLDIWAPCATKAYNDAIAGATNTYE
ncbi:MAG: hypothetical protein Q9226_002312 [Calogaya cf. arnoldii]